MVIALGLILIEILVWWLTHETTHTADDLLARVGTKLERHLSRGGMPEKPKRVGGRTQRLLSWFGTTTFRDVVRRFVIRPGEMINTGWLMYIIFAQTFGKHVQFPTLYNQLILKGLIKPAIVCPATGPRVADLSISRLTITTLPMVFSYTGVVPTAYPCSSCQ